MPDLLIELFSEEIPARMQRRAADDLRKLVTDALVERGFVYEGAKAFATPRRLALHVAGLPAKGRDVREEKKGPRVGAPEAAIAGFLKGAGLTDIAQAKIEKDPKKGVFYVAVTERPGRATTEVVADIMPGIVKSFPWPKSMRWGAASASPGSLAWVRPLHTILCTFGPETEEPEVVHFSVDGIESGALTRGHRFHAPAPIKVRRFADYAAKLEKAKVILDADRRKDIILADSRNLAFAQGLELVEDEALLEEVAGLVEWPVVLMGRFDESFLAIPPEVIRATIRANQKCFVLSVWPEIPSAPHPEERSRRDRVSKDDPGGAANTPNTAPSGQAWFTRPLEHPSRRRFAAPQDEGHISGQPAMLEPPTSRSSLGEGTGEGQRDGGDDALSAQANEVGAAPHPDLLPGSAERGGELAPRFLLVANIEATDGGKSIVAGNERVIRARLSDALHFWKTDRGNLPNIADYTEAAKRLGLDLTKPLDQRMAKLAHLNVVFHEKLGTQGERVERIAALARELAPIVGADPALAARAALLAKADLTTEVVGEFPETQGLMGRRYAALQGEHPSVCAAIEEHYKPQGPGDRVPTDPVSIAVALADKLDTLVGFWAIDEKPTGSKDPFALRRAALGVVRLVVENDIRLKFLRIAWLPTSQILSSMHFAAAQKQLDTLQLLVDIGLDRTTAELVDNSIRMPFTPDGSAQIANSTVQWSWDLSCNLLSFFHDRLKVQLREQGARHDLVDAVLSSTFSPWEKVAAERPDEGQDLGEDGAGAAGVAGANSPASYPSPGRSAATLSQRERESAANDDLLLVVRRVEALGRLLDSEDGKNLLAGARRAANILRIEEKKDGESAFEGAIDPHLLAAPEEKALAQVLNAATRHAAEHVAREDFEGAMRAIAQLRPAVDAFFDKVLVNAEDKALRANRLKLLAGLRRATRTVADFSKIGG